MDIKEILKKFTNDLLSEEALTEISSAFEKAVTEKLQVHVEKALLEQDEDYASKLQKLLTVIDEDHTKKLVNVVEAIDKNHAAKFKTVVGKFETELNKNANMFKEEMINNISTYLEAYIDEAIPADKINEAVSSKRANVVLEQIKEILGVDTALAQKSIKSAIVDGKRQIDEANTRLEAVQKELEVLREQNERVNSELVLEKKTAGLSDKKRTYIQKVMSGKSSQFIAENIDYALNLFDKSATERLQTLKTEAVTKTSSNKVDRPVIEEKVTNEAPKEEQKTMSPYLNELKKF
jgi:hypothetical protein